LGSRSGVTFLGTNAMSKEPDDGYNYHNDEGSDHGTAHPTTLIGRPARLHVDDLTRQMR
jgi:hypothetical protein